MATTIEGAVIAALLADAPVKAKVKTRVTPWPRPQGSVLPALTSTVISDQPGVTHKGAEGLSELRLQLDAWAATKTEARTVARAVRAKLHGFKGTVAGVELQAVFQDSERDLFEGEDPDAVHRVSMDFIIWGREP